MNNAPGIRSKGAGDCMILEDRFVVVANIERFTAALQAGRLDHDQQATVRRLLSEYRRQLAVLDGLSPDTPI
jgi:hypothetical protein